MSAVVERLRREARGWLERSSRGPLTSSTAVHSATWYASMAAWSLEKLGATVGVTIVQLPNCGGCKREKSGQMRAW